MTTADLAITAAAGGDSRIRRLVRDLDTDLAVRYPDDPYSPDDAAARLDADVRFLLAELDGRPVGCCAIQPAPGGAELKRMYVTPQARGRGIARRLLAEAEDLAAALGHPQIRLETGIHQPEAITLYTRTGYLPIPAYPPYQDNPLSRCYAKTLAP
ncbi:GNAT family N-acetyltransferase [Nonomuraea sp. SBT364]|uniref:GNAT family N-acetyltransferase n=1 Tax=Nonomuraea sp. SBT364 TaxID=1580530 RepID=UPI00066C7DE4|nr:GNAT family N-acetyltransferase [Nonomuraea sp. SBT364]